MRTFAELEKRWSAWLSSNGLPAEIWWTFRDDFAWDLERLTLVVVSGNDAESRSWAEQLFDTPDARTHGVEISLVSASETTSFSSLFVPHSAREAEQLMIGGEKLCIPMRRLHIEVDPAFVNRRGPRVPPRPTPVDGLHSKAEVERRVAR